MPGGEHHGNQVVPRLVEGLLSQDDAAVLEVETRLAVLVRDGQRCDLGVRCRQGLVDPGEATADGFQGVHQRKGSAHGFLPTLSGCSRASHFNFAPSKQMPSWYSSLRWSPEK